MKSRKQNCGERKRQKMKRFISIALAAMLTLTAFSGCSKKPASSSQTSEGKASLTFVWWGNQTRNDRTQKLISQYESENPNVTITPQFTDWNSYWNKLATQEAANSTPDIIQMDYSYINQYVDKHLLLDMTPYTKNGVFDTTNIPKDVLTSGTLNSKLYAISIGSNVLSLVYDPAVVQKAGLSEIPNSWTWEDFDKYVNTIYQKTGVPSEPLFFTDGSQWIEYVARENGNSLYSKDGKSLGFKDTKVLTDVYDRLLAHTKDGSFVSPDKVASVTTVEQNPIVSGAAWLSSCWSNQYVALATAAKRNLKMINMPVEKSDKEMGLYNKPGQFLSVSATTKYKDASMKFINYFENSVEANDILLGERGVPTNTKVAEAIKPKVDSYTAITFDYVNLMNSKKLVSTIDPPYPAASNQVGAISKQLYDKVAYQKEAPAQAAADYIKQANAALSSQ